MCKSHETPMEYLRRAVSNLNYEPESLLDELPSANAILEYFDLWHKYDTDLGSGIISAIEAGDSPKAWNDFVRKYKLDWDIFPESLIATTEIDDIDEEELQAAAAFYDDMADNMLERIDEF